MSVDLPDDLNLGGVPVTDVANSFPKHFHDKILLNVNKTNVNVDAVYNGKCKLIVQNQNFMLKSDVKECIMNLPNKKCEGFDRIPVCMLKDSCEIILDPISSLFSKRGAKLKLKTTVQSQTYVLLQKFLNIKYFSQSKN